VQTEQRILLPRIPPLLSDVLSILLSSDDPGTVDTEACFDFYGPTFGLSAVMSQYVQSGIYFLCTLDSLTPWSRVLLEKSILALFLNLQLLRIHFLQAVCILLSPPQRNNINIFSSLTLLQ
jgi:hypothetical protein